MIWIINQIAVEIGGAARLFRVNQHRVINPQMRQSGEKSDKQIAPIEDGIELFVRPLLIPDARLKKSPGIAEPPVGRPTVTDVSLEDVTTFCAQIPQVFVAGENNALRFGQGVPPGRTTCDLPNSLRQIVIIQWRRVRIESG